jgi:hypothetical protein
MAKTTKTLAELKAEREEALKKYDAEIQAKMNEEFHSVWEDTIKPVLHKLKETMDEVTDRFQDYQEEFQGYLRNKEPDVTPNLLAEIYGDALIQKAENKKRPEVSKRSWTEETKISHVKAYDKAVKKREGASYLKDNDLNSNNIQSWRKAFLAALEATEALSDKP